MAKPVSMEGRLLDSSLAVCVPRDVEALADTTGARSATIVSAEVATRAESANPTEAWCVAAGVVRAGGFSPMTNKKHAAKAPTA
jgi:hypothetical protein